MIYLLQKKIIWDYTKKEKYKINETIRDGKYEKVYLEHKLRWFELVLYFNKNV